MNAPDTPFPFDAAISAGAEDFSFYQKLGVKTLSALALDWLAANG